MDGTRDREDSRLLHSSQWRPRRQNSGTLLMPAFMYSFLPWMKHVAVMKSVSDSLSGRLTIALRCTGEGIDVVRHAG
jgi:hypothetical protein